MPTTTILIALGAVGVMAWYYAEWRKCTDRGERMSLVRNPLALFALTFRRMWRNRSLVAILLGLWLLSAALYAFVYHPLVVVPYVANSGFGVPSPQPGLEWGDLVGSLRAHFASEWHLGLAVAEMLKCLPQVESMSIGFGGGLMHILALAVLAGALIYVWIKPPAWLPATAYRSIHWPACVTLAAFLTMAEWRWLEFEAMRTGAMDYSRWGTCLNSIASLFLAGALTALLWHVAFQVGRGQDWRVRRALVASIEKWLPVALVMLLIYLPSGLSILLINKPLSVLPTYLKLVLLFVPWIILESKGGLGPAIVENFRLIGRHWKHLTAFLLRYIIIVWPVSCFVSAISRLAPWQSPANELLGLGASALRFVLLLAAVVLYTELRKTEQHGEPQETGHDEETDRPAVQPTDG